MADTYNTAAELTTLNDKNAVDYGVTDLFDDAPLIQKLGAVPASNGTLHKYIKETGLASAGYRTINNGLYQSDNTDVMVTVSLAIMDASFAEDKAAADAYKLGAGAWVARRAKSHLKAAMFKTEKQVLGGTVYGDPAGFTGFADGLNALANPMVISAGGSTAGGSASVYLIRTNDDGTDVALVMGQDGNIVVSETVEQRVDDATGKHYPAYYTPIQGWMGLQTGSLFSVARIANIDATHPLTDILIEKARALFPAARQPNVIAMGRAQLGQLQASRTAFSPTGSPALIPDSSQGVPIVVTDGLLPIENVVS